VGDLAKILKAPGDPTRFAIFELVRGWTQGGCSDEDANDSLSRIAERLRPKELRNSGLITCEKCGQRLHCWVDPEVRHELEQFAGEGAGAAR
jgi:hypothetical protein